MPQRAEALSAWGEAAERFWHNPSAPYRAAHAAHRQLEVCRSQLLEALGGSEAQLVFTSGATESVQGIIRHFAQQCPGQPIAYSAVEHPCVREAAQTFSTAKPLEMPVDEHGRVALAQLGELLAQRPALVCVQAANNETGVVQPWAEVVAEAAPLGIPVLVDAAQWLGKRPAAELTAAPLLCACAHKLGGPPGVGLARLRPADVGLRFQLGGQEHGHRGGTENLPGIRGFAAAWQASEAQMAAQRRRWAEGRAAFEAILKAQWPDGQIVGGSVDRLENTCLWLAPRHRNTRWVTLLDKRGFAVSSGAACATGKGGPSPVLAAMGLGDAPAARALRFSASWQTTAEDWLALADALRNTWLELESTASSQVIDLSNL